MAENEQNPLEPPVDSATQAQQDLIKRMQDLASEMEPAAPAAAPAADKDQQDLMKRMEQLAAEMAPPAPAPAAAPAAVPDQQDLMKRMQDLAIEMAPPPPRTSAPKPAEVSAPAPAPAPLPRAIHFSPPEAAPVEPAFEAPPPFQAPAAAPAAFSVPAAGPAPIAAPAPAAVPAPGLEAVGETVRQLSELAERLRETAARQSATTQELAIALADREKRIAELEARPADAAVPLSAAAPADDRVLGEVSRSLLEMKTAMEEQLAQFEARFGRKLEAARPPAAGPVAPVDDRQSDAVARSLRELKVALEKNLTGREKDMDDFEARLERRLEAAQAPSADSGRGFDTLMDMIRDLQASTEMMRSTLAHDISTVKGRIDAALSGQLAPVRAPLARPVPMPPGTPAFTNIEDLRTELLAPMAAMKGQLLELTLSYHQLSLRLAVLAAGERSARPPRLE